MLWRRRILLGLSFLLVGGSIVCTLGYAMYLRSDAYRRGIEADLSQYLGLPASVGRVELLSRHSRAFIDIEVALPRHEIRVFACRRAVWRQELVDGEPRVSLDIHDGEFLLGNAEFSPEDYRQMLRGGLGHDFAALNLSHIYLNDVDVLWRQPGFVLNVGDADGEVLLDGDDTGQATLASRRLNGVQVPEPIHIRALFTPGAGLRFHQVVLESPRIPLRSLALDRILGTNITGGWFDGTLTFRETESGPVFNLRGAIGDARLNELTRRVIGGPYRGRVDVELSEAVFDPAGIRSLAFSGRVTEIRLAEFAALAGYPQLDGTANLRVHQARLRDGSISHVSAAGEIHGLDMATVTGLIGRGTITGTLHGTVNSLLVVDDAIRWADVDLDVEPPPGSDGTIDRQVIVEAAESVLNVDIGRLASLLPDTVSYARLGCKLLIEGERLTVQGSHGDDGRTILSVDLMGRELGVVRQPGRTFHIPNPIRLLREHIMQRNLQEWLEQNTGWPFGKEKS